MANLHPPRKWLHLNYTCNIPSVCQRDCDIILEGQCGCEYLDRKVVVARFVLMAMLSRLDIQLCSSALSNIRNLS